MALLFTTVVKLLTLELNDTSQVTVPVILVISNFHVLGFHLPFALLQLTVTLYLPLVGKDVALLPSTVNAIVLPLYFVHFIFYHI